MKAGDASHGCQHILHPTTAYVHQYITTEQRKKKNKVLGNSCKVYIVKTTIQKHIYLLQGLLAAAGMYAMMKHVTFRATSQVHHMLGFRQPKNLACIEKGRRSVLNFRHWKEVLNT